MSFLTLSNVNKFYGDLQVVKSMNLSVEQGEFVSLLGPSGCGKTTCLQMIAGFTPVSQGRITLAGRDITHARPNTRGLGIVFQSYALFPHMTVAENVRFGLEMRKVSRAEQEARVKRVLSLVHLEGREGRYPRELSGGQRQRVALARALVIEPPVLLLDEPLSNLDAKLREEMQFELRRIQRTVGTTTIMVTHDQHEALSVSDRVVVMEQGMLVQADAPYALYEQPSNAFVSSFVGKSNLLPGRVRVDASGAAGVVLDAMPGLPLAAPAVTLAAGTAILFSLRPEKIRLTSAGTGRIDGRVAERFFLGSHWLYRLETPLGELVAMSGNDGAAAVADGATTGVSWDDVSVRVLPAAANTTEAVAA
ncbi:ABC transporter ATP-binding protein [Cupriavidus plantarum]|uniref:ABC transporter ATP-binding protein n=1 Tax=Cupriavidus plantarum TaxID=942865 RepID=UPI001B2A81D5|nr:ABC transporter ATP-binding protein [Cupriavidus plantarum]CAG2145247.1 Spermidine/putrescine import ATP-binding protein PotA [Cupriavidus plantarum]SMR86054.1 putative spermidine/putrescine transport system ATP-binding protein [Cupriavidus plantarum]